MARAELRFAETTEPEPANDQQTWFVLRVIARQERFVIEAMTDKGIAAYAPLHVTRPLKARRKATRTRPLIPGYIFVILPDDEAIDAARNLRPVIEIMCREGRPVRVPPIAIGWMVFAESCHMFDETWEAPKGKGGPRYSHRWKQGDRVRVDDGPFMGWLAEVKRTDNRHDIAVLIDIFGRLTEVSIPEHHLVLPDEKGARS